MKKKKKLTYPEIKDKYWCDETGRVFNSKKELKPFPVSRNSAYQKLHLSKISGGHKPVYVHRIIAYEFCNPPHNWRNMVVNHKDEDPRNNHKDNLEWMTQMKNIHLSLRHPNPPVAIIQYDLKTGEHLKEFFSISEAKRAGFINAWYVCTGRRKSCKGFGFKFK